MSRLLGEPNLVHGVVGLNPAGGQILLEAKQGFIEKSLSYPIVPI